MLEIYLKRGQTAQDNRYKIEKYSFTSEENATDITEMINIGYYSASNIQT